MLAVKTPKKDAEKTKQVLREANALAEGISATRDDDFVYFPVKKKIKGFTCVRKKFVNPAERALSVRDALRGSLSKNEARFLKSSYDTVGSIAVLEIPLQLEKKEKVIARALLASNRRIATVLRKKGAFKGEYRVRTLEWLAGQKRFSSLYRESGCVMKVDLRKTYFSPRLSHERLRIAGQVRSGEHVLALFAGVGPYALVIAKKMPSAKVVAIELNPYAVRLMRENVALNKLGNVEAMEGDVRVVLPSFRNWADRITMPLPHTGEDFLDCVLPSARKGCVVHFYAFGPQDEPFGEAVKKIRRACAAQERVCRIVGKRVVRPYAPKIVQAVLDFVVS